MNKQDIHETEKKEFTVEEAFCAVPELLKYFQRIGRHIDNFDKYEWEESVTKEKMIRKRQLLADVFSSLTIYDLNIAFYLRALRGLCPLNVQHMLREYFEKEIEVDGTFTNCKGENPLNFGWLKSDQDVQED